MPTSECKPIDHSDFKVAGNFYGLERVRSITDCAKCGRPVFDEWFRKLDWKSTDRAYWKQVFKDASAQKVFFFRAEPGTRYDSFQVSVDPDNGDPASILAPHFPRWVKNGDIVVEIKQRRYRERMSETKEHHYGVYQPSIDAEIHRMMGKLDYVDNTRFAAVDNRKDMRRYRDAASRGCCGSCDKEITIYGRKFMIGCNYGH
jgi:hypothetical protein